MASLSIKVLWGVSFRFTGTGSSFFVRVGFRLSRVMNALGRGFGREWSLFD